MKILLKKMLGPIMGRMRTPPGCQKNGFGKEYCACGSPGDSRKEREILERTQGIQGRNIKKGT
jgi:hypothetical protein